MPVMVFYGDNPEHLALSDHLYCFDSLNDRPSRPLCSRSLHGTQSTFDMAMVGFDSVILILTTAVAASGTDLA